MATGGVFAGIAFVVSGLIELQLKVGIPIQAESCIKCSIFNNQET